jgi:hypothetical protein
MAERFSLLGTAPVNSKKLTFEMTVEDTQLRSASLTHTLAPISITPYKAL